MRKTPPGAGWTKRPSPVLQGQSAESATTTRTATYKWETPRATELRFGMEITMYVANR